MKIKNSKSGRDTHMKKGLKGLSLFIMLFAVSFTSIAAFKATTTTVEASVAGWRQDSHGWWYQNANGSYPRTQWQRINHTWYYFDATGYMATGWLSSGRTWYYLHNSGAMAEGWTLVGNTWYYLNHGTGQMATGWLNLNGTWYHLQASGAMSANRWEGNYYLEDSGAMATNKWIDQYYVGADGAWIPNYTDSQDRPITEDVLFRVDVGNGRASNVYGSFEPAQSDIITRLVNEERVKAGLPALKINSALEAASHIRAVELHVNFSHTRPNGLPYHSITPLTNGENIAYMTSVGSAEMVMKAWMDSEGHRANILNPRYQTIGVGAFRAREYINDTDFEYVYHYVQLFGLNP